jgi:hypothetical protein
MIIIIINHHVVTVVVLSKQLNSHISHNSTLSTIHPSISLMNFNTKVRFIFIFGAYKIDSRSVKFDIIGCFQIYLFLTQKLILINLKSEFVGFLNLKCDIFLNVDVLV